MPTGSISDPASLYDASNSNQVLPGDTILLRGGTYDYSDLQYEFNNAGSSESPITIKNYPGELVILKGRISQLGDNVIWQSDDYNLVITSDNTDRFGDVATESGVTCYTNGCAFRNLIIHNLCGVGMSPQGNGAIESYGNIIHSNGYEDEVREHGPGVYSHNDNSENTKTLSNLIILNSYRYGLQLYSATSNDIHHYVIQDVVSNRTAVVYNWNGADPAVDDVTIDHLWLFGGNVRFGDGLAVSENGQLTATNLYIDEPDHPFNLHKFEVATISGVFTGPQSGRTITERTDENSTYTLTGTYDVSSGLYTNFVPNEYAPNFATLSYLDFDETGSLNLQAISGFDTWANGDDVIVHNPMLFRRGVLDENTSISYNATTMTLTTTGWTTPLPQGEATMPSWLDDDIFSARHGVFILEKI